MNGVLKEINENLMFFNKEYSQLFLLQFTGFELEYYRTNPNEQISEMTFPEDSPVPSDWSVRFPGVDDETQERLDNSPEVAKMGIWPAADSVQVIGDTVVIKLSEVD